MMRKASIKEASYDQGRGHFLQAHIKALGEEYLDFVIKENELFYAAML